jgi:hypothetical protein
MAQRYATVAEVRTKLPALFAAPAVEDTEIQSVIDDQACFLGLVPWGDCASVASKYAAAHMVLLAHPELPEGGQKSPETANANGPASRSMAISALEADDLWWGLTPCGVQYLEMRKARLGVGVLVLGVTSRTARPWRA